MSDLRKRLTAKHVMWGCVAVLALVVVLSIAGANAGYLLFALPCVVMMGAMMWVMMGGMGGGGKER
jgi:peptidoglycan/LPS O-acetylase OafA/YrhL